MPSQIKGEMKRLVKIHGVLTPVIVKINEDGVCMSVPRSRLSLSSSWEHIARNMQTPMNVPSFLANRPLEFLKYQAKKLEKKEE